MFSAGRLHVSANASSRKVIKGHGKTQRVHLEVLHTILKCREGFEFSICQDSQNLFFFLRPVTMNEKRENKERQDGYVFLLRTSALHPSNNLGCKWENLRENRAKGQMQREKAPHKLRDTKESLLPTSHHQCPRNMLGPLGLSNEL